MRFQKDDRVRYISGRHWLGPGNPLIGSKYECEGTISGVNSRVNRISVNWDNGTTNFYAEDDLELAEHKLDCNNPNAVFRSRKRRQS